MATTNLISRTVGTLLFESGNGVPNHTSPTGSIYADLDSSINYINRSTGGSGTSWLEQHKSLWRGGMEFEDLTVEAPNGWVQFTETGFFTQEAQIRTNEGITLDAATNDYRLNVDNAGTYLISLSCTVSSTAAGLQQIGVCINGVATPSNGDIIQRYLNSTVHQSAHFNVCTIKTLAANDKISFSYNTGGNPATFESVKIYVMEI